MSRSIENTQVPVADAIASEVEIIELSAVGRRRRGLLGRVLFVVAVAGLAGLIAIAGVPSRTSFNLNNPLPNLLQQNQPR